MDWSSKATDVQGLWNDFETKLINIIDELVPLTEYKNNLAVRAPFPRIKSKLNLRKRLIKNFKRSPTLNIKHPIKNLNYEIKVHFYSEKRTNVRKNLKPGNSKSLWDAVKIAKDTGTAPLPCSMTFENVKILEHERADCFASFFEGKVNDIPKKVRVDNDVYKYFCKNEFLKL